MLVNKKTSLLDFKKLSDLVDSKVVKNKKFNTLNTKVSSLENKIPDLTTLIYIINTMQIIGDIKVLKKLEILIKMYVV